jgi:hypothetical protein
MLKPPPVSPVELARVWQTFGALLREASTLPPPQRAEPIRLDVTNAGREHNAKPN